MNKKELELLEAIAKKLNILSDNNCIHEWEPEIRSDYWVCKKCGEIKRN